MRKQLKATQKILLGLAQPAHTHQTKEEGLRKILGNLNREDNLDQSFTGDIRTLNLPTIKSTQIRDFTISEASFTTIHEDKNQNIEIQDFPSHTKTIEDLPELKNPFFDCEELQRTMMEVQKDHPDLDLSPEEPECPGERCREVPAWAGLSRSGTFENIDFTLDFQSAIFTEGQSPLADAKPKGERLDSRVVETDFLAALTGLDNSRQQ